MAAQGWDQQMCHTVTRTSCGCVQLSCAAEGDNKSTRYNTHVTTTKAMTQKKHWGDPGYYFASMQKDRMHKALAPVMHKVNNATPYCHCAQQRKPSQNTQASITCSAGLCADQTKAVGQYMTADCKARKVCWWLCSLQCWERAETLRWWFCLCLVAPQTAQLEVCCLQNGGECLWQWSRTPLGAARPAAWCPQFAASDQHTLEAASFADQAETSCDIMQVQLTGRLATKRINYQRR